MNIDIKELRCLYCGLVEVVQVLCPTSKGIDEVWYCNTCGAVLARRVKGDVNNGTRS